jgi:hypothetical protein
MIKIINDIKDFSGNVLCVGVLDDNILMALKKIKDANVFTVDRVHSRSFFRKKKAKTKDGKKVNIKKLRKTFKKKSIDHLICDFNEISEFFKYFIGDSVIISRGIVYIYGVPANKDYEELASRFKRYGATVKIEKEEDKILIVVDNKKSKTNWFKNKFYIVVDTFHNIGDLISAALIS